LQWNYEGLHFSKNPYNSQNSPASLPFPAVSQLKKINVFRNFVVPIKLNVSKKTTFPTIYDYLITASVSAESSPTRQVPNDSTRPFIPATEVTFALMSNIIINSHVPLT